MSVTITGQGLLDILEAMHDLTEKEVLVGIPHGEARTDADGLTNAQIGYIQETGSPANNLPARPFLAKGIEDVQPKIADYLTKAVDQAIAGNLQGVERYYNMAGMTAQNSVKRRINNGEGFEPLSPRTIAIRQAKGKTRIKPLIDTGQLRNSITYVIRKRGD